MSFHQMCIKQKTQIKLNINLRLTSFLLYPENLEISDLNKSGLINLIVLNKEL